MSFLMNVEGSQSLLGHNLSQVQMRVAHGLLTCSKYWMQKALSWLRFSIGLTLVKASFKRKSLPQRKSRIGLFDFRFRSNRGTELGDDFLQRVSGPSCKWDGPTLSENWIS